MSDEKTLFKGSSSPVVNIGVFVLCGIVAVAGLVFSFLSSGPIRIALWVIAGVAVIYALVQWLLIRIRVYEVTTERIRVTTGMLTRRTDELELYRVKDATLVEPLVSRIFGCGTIAVTTNDASTPNLDLVCIRGARELREQLRQNIEICRDRKRVRLAELE